MLQYSCYFALIFCISAVVSQYDAWLALPPVSIHQWRQADGEALAWHYAQGSNFFAPTQFNLFQAGDAHAVGEFPLLYWLAGLISRYFHAPDYPLRWIGLGMLFIGFWAFGWMILRITQKPLVAALGTGLLLTSPVLAYYGPSFLPDAPAFCVILMLGACLLRADQRQSRLWIAMAAICAALAIMLKISMAILPLALVLVWVANRKRQPWPADSIWAGYGPVWATVFVFGAVSVCRWWIAQYNDLHHAHYFFADIRPLWRYDGPAIREILRGIGLFSLPAFASLGLYLASVGSLWLWWKRPALVGFVWRKSILFVAVGCLAFVLLWFRMLREHDYYAICLMVFPAMVLLLGIRLAVFRFGEKKLAYLLGLCCLLGLGHNYYLLDRRLNEAYFPRSTRNLPPEAFLSSAQLTQAGIPPEARVFCPEDPSPNIALLAMQRHGWSGYNFGDQMTKDTLQKYANLFGLSHLALRDTLDYNPLYQQFFPVRLFELNGWYFYLH